MLTRRRKSHVDQETSRNGLDLSGSQRLRTLRIGGGPGSSRSSKESQLICLGPGTSKEDEETARNLLCLGQGSSSLRQERSSLRQGSISFRYGSSNDDQPEEHDNEQDEGYASSFLYADEAASIADAEDVKEPRKASVAAKAKIAHCSGRVLEFAPVFEQQSPIRSTSAVRKRKIKIKEDRKEKSKHRRYELRNRRPLEYTEDDSDISMYNDESSIYEDYVANDLADRSGLFDPNPVTLSVRDSPNLPFNLENSFVNLSFVENQSLKDSDGFTIEEEASVQEASAHHSTPISSFDNIGDVDAHSNLSHSFIIEDVISDEGTLINNDFNILSSPSNDFHADGQSDFVDLNSDSNSDDQSVMNRGFSHEVDDTQVAPIIMVENHRTSESNEVLLDQSDSAFDDSGVVSVSSDASYPVNDYPSVQEDVLPELELHSTPIFRRRSRSSNDNQQSHTSTTNSSSRNASNRRSHHRTDGVFNPPTVTDFVAPPSYTSQDMVQRWYWPTIEPPSYTSASTLELPSYTASANTERPNYSRPSNMERPNYSRPSNIERPNYTRPSNTESRTNALLTAQATNQAINQALIHTSYTAAPFPYSSWSDSAILRDSLYATTSEVSQTNI